jgi:phospholipid/cholesterol/gamma-HCH transport system substrate-binding protein
MKKDAGSTIKLGVFISLGVAVLILGIYFIGEKQQIFKRTFRVSGVFRDVAGLQEGNNVRFSGINVGTVDNIRIVSDSSVRVEILIGEGIRQFIKKDALASIGSEGLMGNKVLVVTPGTGGQKEIENNDSIGTVQPINLDDLFTSLKTTVDNTNDITSDLAKITGNIQAGKGTIGRLLMNQAVAQKFDSILVNLKDGSSDFKKLTEKAKKSWLLWGF